MNVPYSLWVGVVTANVVIAGVVVAAAVRAGNRLAAWAVAAWIGLALALGGFGAFKASEGSRVPYIAFGIVVPIVAGVWFGRRHDPLASTPVSWLIGVQVYRVVGALFLVAWALDLMPGQFALPAGIGDVLVGLAAPLVARRVATHGAGAHTLGIAWVAGGLADLVVAVGAGFLTSPSAYQQLALGNPNALISRLPFVLIPTFAVPLSVLLHLAALRRLMAESLTAGETTGRQLIKR